VNTNGYTVRGRTQGIRAWSRELGVTACSFYQRAKAFGISTERAIEHYIDNPKGSAKARNQVIAAAIKRHGGLEALVARADAMLAKEGAQ
jgi:hypothetical protein